MGLVDGDPRAGLATDLAHVGAHLADDAAGELRVDAKRHANLVAAAAAAAAAGRGTPVVVAAAAASTPAAAVRVVAASAVASRAVGIASALQPVLLLLLPKVSLLHVGGVDEEQGILRGDRGVSAVVEAHHQHRQRRPHRRVRPDNLDEPIGGKDDGTQRRVKRLALFGTLFQRDDLLALGARARREFGHVRLFHLRRRDDDVYALGLRLLRSRAHRGIVEVGVFRDHLLRGSQVDHLDAANALEGSGFGTLVGARHHRDARGVCLGRLLQVKPAPGFLARVRDDLAARADDVARLVARDDDAEARANRLVGNRADRGVRLVASRLRFVVRLAVRRGRILLRRGGGVVGRFRLDRIGVVHRGRVVGGLGSARTLLVVSLIIVSGSVLGGFLLLDGLLDLPGTARRFLPRRLRGLRGLRGLLCASLLWAHVDRSVRPRRSARRPIDVAAIRVTSNLPVRVSWVRHSIFRDAPLTRFAGSETRGNHRFRRVGRMTPTYEAVDPLSPRAVIAGMLVGFVVSAMNVSFGLKAGWGQGGR